MVPQGGVGDVVLLQEPHCPSQDEVNEDEVDPKEGVVWTNVGHRGSNQLVLVHHHVFVLAPVVPISSGSEVDGQKDSQGDHRDWEEELDAHHQEPRVHERI